MAKLIAFNMITADGYFKGAGGDISWHRVDEEVNDFFIEQLQQAERLVFGRTTFELMENHWQSVQAIKQNPQVAKLMTKYPKIVFSKRRNKSAWPNTLFKNDHLEQEVQQIKKNRGDTIIFGSAELVAALINSRLVDELRFMYNPVALGAGRPFLHEYLEMDLLKVKVFGNGNVLHCYRPV